MKIKIVVSALLISAATMAAVTPASANWFHNKYLGISRNVGSAPNPTPDDVRQGRLPIIVQQENNRPGLFADRRASAWRANTAASSGCEPLTALEYG